MASSKVSLLIFFSRSSSSRAPINSLFIFLISSFLLSSIIAYFLNRTCRRLAASSYMKVSCSAPVVLPQLRPDFHGNLKINRQTHQCNVFLIESARSSLLINGHTVIIICCQFTTKFFLFLPVCQCFWQNLFLSSEVCQVPEN